MLLDQLSPAEQEAWSEVEEAEQALELARLRLMAVTNSRQPRLPQVEPEAKRIA
jgi:hypothetical protein